MRVSKPASVWIVLFAALSACVSTRSSPFRPPAPVEHAPRRASFDVEHYALRIELFPAERRIEGECQVRLFARDAPLSVLALDFCDLAVEEVLAADGEALPFEHDGATLTIALSPALEPREFTSVTVRYSGLPRAGLWFVRERDGAPTQVYTQGECEDSRRWFPCVDVPSERATSELEVVMPAGWRSLAAGEFVDRRDVATDRAAERWRMTTAHPAYLTTLVAGEFEVLEEDWDGAALQYWAAPELAPFLADSLAATPRVLDCFSELTGVRYPFSKYAQACVDNFLFGGMENITATTLTDTALSDEAGLRDTDPTDLVAHEAAHQWFGDLATCAHWSEIWLNEGFATYFSELYREATEGVEAFRASMRDVQERYLALDVGAQRRPTVWNVYREPMDLFGSGHAYPGGAARLHLLRFVIGDEAFFRGLKRYMAENYGRPVTSADLRRALERESGLDLRPFFEQWLHGAGYPEFAVQWGWDARRQSVRVDVEQVQKPLNGTPMVFVTPVDIEVRDDTGARVTRVTVDRRRQSFEIAATTQPTWVVFDKHGWIPKRCATKRSNDEWLALAAHADDVNLRRDALAALSDVLADSSDEKLRWRIVDTALERLGDSQPSVRVAAARAFRRVFTGTDHPISRGMMQAASADRSAAVRVAALETLASWETAAEFVDFAIQQFEARYSYRTMGAAARVLAGADPARARTWIVERLALESPHDALRAALVSALASIPGRAVDDELVKCALDESYGAAPRETAVRELARRSARWPQARQVFLEVLETTQHYRLQNAAIDALGEIGDPASREALIRFYDRTVEPRQRRAVEAAIAAGSS